MEEKKIIIPEDWEIDLEKSSGNNVYLKELKKEPEVKSLPTKWEDLEDFSGWYINPLGKTVFQAEWSARDNKEASKPNYPTKELAEGALALCQLIRFRDAWRDGWIPDYSDISYNKYSIVTQNGKICIDWYTSSQKILSFKTKKLAEKFLETFKDLIETAKDFL